MRTLQPCAGGERLSGSIAAGPSISDAACCHSRAKLRNCFRCSSVRALLAHRRQSRAYLRYSSTVDMAPLVSAGAQLVSQPPSPTRRSRRRVIRRSCALGARIANKNPCLVGNRTNGRALGGGTGVLPMPTAEYFRRQADICIRLSLIASSEEVMTRLIAMAQDITPESTSSKRGRDRRPPKRSQKIGTNLSDARV